MVVESILHIAKLTPDLWTVSSSTVGGQRNSSGDQTSFLFYSWKATHSMICQKKKINKWNSLFQMVIRDKLGKAREPIFTTLFLYGTLTFSHSGPSSFSWPKMFLQKMACTHLASLSCCLLIHLISYMCAHSSTMFLRHQVPRGQRFYLCHFLV